MIKKKNNSSIPDHHNYDIAIIGAGPAGLIAAIESCRDSDRIIVIEQKFRPSMKLRITGRGNCNITNETDIEGFIESYGKNGKFLRNVLDRFSNKDLINYFNDLGVEFELERGRRYFPVSGNAASIADALLNRANDLNIEIKTGLKAENIIYQKPGSFLIKLREQNYSDKENGKAHEINAEKILIATGGRSYPSTGSDGSGYLLAEGLGHTIVPIVPALVPLKGDSSIIEKLNGLSIRNCRVSVFSEGKKIYDRFGEMEFRDNELAGAVILFISRDIVMRIKNRERISIAIDLKPSLDHKKLDKRLLREIQDEKNINCTDILKTLLPGKAIDFFLSETGINGDKKRSQLTSDERRKLRNLLKKINIDIKGSVSLSKALVTSGGVSLKEINSQTMESKLRKGLYFAGEVIDVDGKTGGFNLQAAFSTGWTAGRNMGKGGSNGTK